MTYYADTAYDSTKNYNLPPIDNSEMASNARAVRKYPITQPKGVQCGELLCFSDIRLIEALQRLDEFPQVKADLETAKVHEEYYWSSFKNPKIIVETVTKLLGVFLVIGGGGTIPIAIWAQGLARGLGGCLVIIMPIFILYLVGKYLLRTNLIQDKNNVILKRRTGMVTLNHQGKQVDIPFAELDPYYGYFVSTAGSQNNQLWLAHRLSEASTSSQQYHYNLFEVYQDWEVWQQYMDISQPLPDIPEFEPFRHKDPVTAEYDKKHNRPKDYWKNFDLDAFYKAEKASRHAAESFPWGKTRQEAIASGWRPSGFGQGDWRQG